MAVKEVVWDYKAHHDPPPGLPPPIHATRSPGYCLSTHVSLTSDHSIILHPSELKGKNYREVGRFVAAVILIPLPPL